MIKLRNQQALALGGRGTLAGCDFIPPQDDLQQPNPESLGCQSIALLPRQRLTAHFALPTLETLSRRQPVAVGTHRYGFIRVPAPFNGVDDFLAKEHEIVAGRTRQRDGQQPARLACITRRCGQPVR